MSAILVSAERHCIPKPIPRTDTKINTEIKKNICTNLTGIVQFQKLNLSYFSISESYLNNFTIKID